jgi:hypothetical protein
MQADQKIQVCLTSFRMTTKNEPQKAERHATYIKQLNPKRAKVLVYNGNHCA